MKILLLIMGFLTWGSSQAVAQKKPAPKAPAKAPATAISAATLSAGKSVYVQNCLTCHQADGYGVDGLNPPLIKTNYVLGDKARLTKVVLNGLQGEDIEGEPYNNVMPSFDILTDQQIADVLTYVRNSFGNKASAIKAPEVKAIRASNKKK
ncbi:cytochrome c [Hymenobacter taeanensis]|uniref:Cytochrome c n=1 Tax=Hymenobacter taeanensis TaxID=2735321 RepID=A0A6M6BLX6_9BACT|nr:MULTISPECIES: cytochrome c [Hymenobacter]QJX48977.1 cytochrome c [Hymenobacter taeanensis]UOQ81506.1 cytochrome c [Hymenobacter sp. 5414T-23]